MYLKRYRDLEHNKKKASEWARQYNRRKRLERLADNPAMNRASYVYRLYDRDGALLYVGRTYQDSWSQRKATHRATKRWWPDVDEERTRLEPFETRLASEEAELKAIAEEDPLHNKAGKKDA
ncbi:hypothetical protein [Jiangella anatolica]|uniref:GIY-YIG domain-containing protein n=1 Tax=Jiangella anatolica TaxID=2670374 RepID=A0A2W2C4V6_9ACTN|nr:hypothetical protein [Jiangella anatolica]PZF83239.1 hypothetical protein C1I92_13255 [Jiangella anatolica]